MVGWLLGTDRHMDRQRLAIETNRETDGPIVHQAVGKESEVKPLQQQ